MSLYSGEKTFFKCFDCDSTFEGERHDWNHSPITAPAKCPKCGSWHTCPYNRDFPDDFQDLESYRDIIWERDDEDRARVRKDNDLSSFLESLVKND